MGIEKIIKSGEWENIEFKSSLAERKEILETICAFSNSAGGTILVGVDDEGNVLGIKIGKNTIQELINEIKFSLEPLIIPNIEVVDLKNKKILVINVNEGLNKPYFFKGIAYKRVGRTNQRLSKEEIEKIIVEKYKSRISFEERIVKVSLKDLDEEKIKDFVYVAKQYRNLDLKFVSTREFLKRLGLTKNNNITYAALLCFFKNPQIFLPYCVVKCGKFKNGLVNEKEMKGNLFDQVIKSLEFVKENIKSTYTIDETGKRIEKYEIPIEVLREAIVNALIHRDYEIPSPIYIKIFEDRIEIINPGSLASPLTPEKLKMEHPSVLRNPKIANVFFLYGYVERWEYGTNKMVELCLKNGLREPDFFVEDNFFKVIIYREEVKEAEKQIIELIGKGINTTKELAKRLKVSERSVRKYLLNLIKKGLIVRKKFGRKIFYELS